MAAVFTPTELLRRVLHPLSRRRALLGVDIGDTTTGVALLRCLELPAAARRTEVVRTSRIRPGTGHADGPPRTRRRVRAEPLGTIWASYAPREDGKQRAKAQRQYALDVSQQLRQLAAEHGVGGLVRGREAAALRSQPRRWRQC